MLGSETANRSRADAQNPRPRAGTGGYLSSAPVPTATWKRGSLAVELDREVLVLVGAVGVDEELAAGAGVAACAADDRLQV